MMDQLVLLATYLLTVSVAVERATSFIKLPVSNISFLANNPKLTAQVTSTILGMVTYLSAPMTVGFLTTMPQITAAVLVGLAVSGGSGVWHDILSTLQMFKPAKPVDSK